jgi:hypothetical protein
MRVAVDFFFAQVLQRVVLPARKLALSKKPSHPHEHRMRG